jgi:AAA+ superfamily predicted ATPase
LLDKAVWRRFDEVIKFDMPNLEQIKRLLAVKLRGVRRNFEPTDMNIASLFKGMAHADIERVLRRAVKEMVLAGRDFLEKPHLDAALAREHKPQQ